MKILYNKFSKINIVSNYAVKLNKLYKGIKLRFVDFKYDVAENPTLSKEELIEYNKYRKFTVNKSLCFAPKKSMIFSFDGNVYLCCENKQYSLGNIVNESIHDIWFGAKRTFIDKKINADYNLEYGCVNCKYKILHKDYNLVQAQNFDLRTDNHSVYPARLDFEIHNTCNLECVMCSGIYSSSILSNRDHLPAVPMVYSKDFVNQLDEFIPHILSVNLIGGEPTLIKLYYDIIEKIISINPSCVIHLQTNASNLNDRFKKLLEKGNFQIGISMDALSKNKAENIRKNLDFDKFMTNVNYYLNLYQLNKIKLTINTCPMPDNWEEIMPVIHFCNKHKLPIFFCIVNAPYYNTFVSTSIDFVENVYHSLFASLQSLPRANYFEKNNYDQLKDFLNMLLSWKEIIKENNENRNKLIHITVDELYRKYESVLDKFIYLDQKEKLINKTLEYTKIKFSLLHIGTQKELLIVLIGVIKAPIISSSEEEYLKWAKEYVNVLLFSFENKASVI